MKPSSVIEHDATSEKPFEVRSLIQFVTRLRQQICGIDVNPEARGGGSGEPNQHR
jgi:hypothetical protein